METIEIHKQTNKCDSIIIIQFACFQQGITCIGFKNKQDMDMFTRHVDRIVQIQQDKSTQQAKVRDTSSSSPCRGGQECKRE